MNILGIINLKEVWRIIRQQDLIEHLEKQIESEKVQSDKLGALYEKQIQSKEKEIDKLRRRVKKLEKLT